MMTFEVYYLISKIFEHCLMNGFQIFLTSGDNQFGFKKDLDVEMFYMPLVISSINL